MADRNRGHVGEPAALGSPVAAKWLQYAISWSASSCWAGVKAGVKPGRSNRYDISAPWKAPDGRPEQVVAGDAGFRLALIDLGASLRGAMGTTLAMIERPFTATEPGKERQHHQHQRGELQRLVLAREVVAQMHVARVQPGAKIAVFVDPQNPVDMAIDWIRTGQLGPPPPGSIPGPGEPGARR